jgi:hypothetical protein
MWGEVLPLHSNGMRRECRAARKLAGFADDASPPVSAYDAQGDLLATNDYYSVGGGFVVNGAMSTGAAKEEGRDHPEDLAENFLYKAIRPEDAAGARRTGARRAPQAEEATAQLAAPDGSEADAATTPSIPLEKETQLPDRKTAARGPVVPFVFWDAASLLALTRKHNMVHCVHLCCVVERQG